MIFAVNTPVRNTTSNVSTFTGQDFSIEYPTSFYVASAEASKGGYLDTTIQGPAGYLVRIDETPNGSSGTVEAAAGPVLAALRRQVGYREIALGHTTFYGYDALRWEFEVPEHGVLLHKVDLFFISGSGSEWAILTQAPAADYAGVVGAFDALRSSLTLSSG